MKTPSQGNIPPILSFLHHTGNCELDYFFNCEDLYDMINNVFKYYQLTALDTFAQGTYFAYLVSTNINMPFESSVDMNIYHSQLILSYLFTL
jgi:hypothetical protein